MKIKCNKCKTLLTKDLCKTKGNIGTITNHQESSSEELFGKGMFKEDYAIYSPEKDEYLKGLVVNLIDVVTEIPEFISGQGCCDWSFGETLKCGCGNTVGHMYIDCYEPKIITFISNKIERSYE